MQSRLDIKIYLNTTTTHTLDNMDKVGFFFIFWAKVSFIYTTQYSLTKKLLNVLGIKL